MVWYLMLCYPNTSVVIFIIMYYFTSKHHHFSKLLGISCTLNCRHIYWRNAFPLYGHDYDLVLAAIEKMEENLPGFFYAGKSTSAEMHILFVKWRLIIIRPLFIFCCKNITACCCFKYFIGLPAYWLYLPEFSEQKNLHLVVSALLSWCNNNEFFKISVT